MTGQYPDLAPLHPVMSCLSGCDAEMGRTRQLTIERRAGLRGALKVDRHPSIG